MAYQQRSDSCSCSTFNWFGNLCGRRRRGSGWTRTSPGMYLLLLKYDGATSNTACCLSDRELAPSPFVSKTARFYGVDPLYPEPSPTRVRLTPSEPEEVSRTSTSTTKSTSVLTHASNEQPAWSRSPITTGEKLERLLGENLRTIPENDRYDSTKTPPPQLPPISSIHTDDNRRATFLFSVSTPVDSTYESEDFELIIQGASPRSGSHVPTTDDETRPNTAQTHAFLSEDPYGGTRDAIAGFLAAMRDNRPYDRSTIASRSTEATSAWAVQPLRPGPGPGFSQSFSSFVPFQTLQPPTRPHSQIQIQHGFRSRSNSHTPSEFSTELCFTGEEMSEYGLERRNTLKSTGTFGAKTNGLRPAKGNRGSRRWTEYSK